LVVMHFLVYQPLSSILMVWTAMIVKITMMIVLFVNHSIWISLRSCRGHSELFAIYNLLCYCYQFVLFKIFQQKRILKIEMMRKIMFGTEIKIK
jgi:hypothetical protein